MEDDNGGVWEYLQQQGHGSCGGWQIDHYARPDVITCACGHDFYHPWIIRDEA